MIRLGVLGLFFVVTSAFGTILPSNSLHLQDSLLRDANMTEEEFNAVIDGVTNHWTAIAETHGATLEVEKKWDDPTVNAYADKKDKVWSLHFFGGLARRPEMKADGFTLVVCHELGHLFAGYYFYQNMFSKLRASSEGQADYFASQACMRRIWKDKTDDNARIGATASEFVKTTCDAAWSGTPDRNLCYRIALATDQFADLIAELTGDPKPLPETPEKKMVTKTYEMHPEGQCRVDTYFAGSLCGRDFDYSIIPGLAEKELNSEDAEKQAFQYSCSKSRDTVGVRPGCWFKAKTE